MKTALKFILTIVLLFAIQTTQAQAHNYGSNYNCKLKSGNWLNSEKHPCPGCQAKDKEELEAKKAEEKRKHDVALAKAKEEKEAAEKERLEKLEQEGEGTKVYINGNNTISSESSGSESTKEKSNSKSSSPKSDIVFNAETYYKYYATPEEKHAHDLQVLYGSAADLGASLAQWQAERERKWARERAEYEAVKAQQAQDENEFDQQVKKTNAFLFNGLKNYFSLLSTQLPHVLENNSISWADILGSKDYDILMGKNASYVQRKVTTSGPSLSKKIKKNDFKIVKLPNYFKSQSLKLVNGSLASIYYWVKTDFYAHNIDFIFDEQEILVGIQVELKTKGIHIKDYYDDLIGNLSNSYLMADANTFITKDKICVLDFEHLTIFDLNYLKPDTYFKFPEVYSSYFNPNGCLNCINQLGIKIAGSRPEGEPASATVTIAEILPNSISEKNGLQQGDLIFSINEISISHPIHLQWFFHAYPKEKKFTINYQRGNEFKTMTLTTN